MTKYTYPLIPQLCECGCGETVWFARNGVGGIRRFISGHQGRGKPHSAEWINKIRNAQKGQKRPSTTGDNNPAKRPEVRAKLSGINNHFYGKHHTKESIEQMVKSNQQNYINMKTLFKGHPLRRPHRSDLWYESKGNGKLCFRSSWELAFAKYLDSINELWFYEFWQFDLGTMTYTPDFYLPRKELFVEIKGLWRDTKEKFDRFKEEYPFENILLIQYKPPYYNIVESIVNINKR